MERNIADRRAKLDLKQGQIAALVGVTQGFVAKVEAGKMPQSKIKKWASAYRVTVKKFKALVTGSKWEVLPLWQFATKEVQADVQHIDCTRKEAATA